MKKNLIIAFLLGMLIGSHAFAMKVPDLVLSDKIDADLREMIEDYILPIINGGRYVMNLNTSGITSSTTLEAGAFQLDDSGVTKYLVISNGTNNYRVSLTQL